MPLAIKSVVNSCAFVKFDITKIKTNIFLNDNKKNMCLLNYFITVM